MSSNSVPLAAAGGQPQSHTLAVTLGPFPWVPSATKRAIAPRLRSALTVISSDDRATWPVYGGRLRAFSPLLGHWAFVEWIMSGDGYLDRDDEYLFFGYRPDPAGADAIFADARQRGWTYEAPPIVVHCDPAPQAEGAPAVALEHIAARAAPRVGARV